MSKKTLTTAELDRIANRKAPIRPNQVHKDKNRYSRKRKHRGENG